MVVYSYYPEDVRVKKEADALSRNGHSVDVVCLRNRGEPRRERVDKVDVIRLPLQRAREGGRLRYFYQYAMFFLLSFYVLVLRHLKERYKVIHAHSLPDYLVFTGLVPRLFGAMLVLDLHEAMPEIVLSKLGASKSGAFYKLSVWLEKICSGYADRLITASEEIKKALVSRGIDGEKITVICNVPETMDFKEPRPRKANSIVYAGSLYEYLDMDTLLSAVEMIKDMELHIYGQGILMQQVGDTIAKKNIGTRAFVHGRIPHGELMEKLPEHAAGILPLRDTPITRMALGNKAFEYCMSGLPVISTRLPGIATIFDDSCFYYYTPGKPESLCAAIKSMLSSGEEAQRKVRNSQSAIMKKHLEWKYMERALLDMYSGLLSGRKTRQTGLPGAG